MENNICRVANSSERAVLVALLNHIEDVVDDENWSKIDPALWNAVSVNMLAVVAHGGTMAPRMINLHVGDSQFESWYSEQVGTHTGVKQVARNAYEAGMNDPITAKQVEPTQQVAMPQGCAKTEFDAVREALSNHLEFNDELDHEMASRLLVVLDDLGKEALTSNSTRSPSSPVVAEAVPWVYRRATRCPHGVALFNHCKHCD